MARTTVLLNRGGGAVAADPKIAGKVRKAFKAAKIDARVEMIDGGDYEVRCRAIAKRGDELLVVGGGDGSISAAASALAGSKTALGILPLGTLNHFARDLGLPTDIGEAAQLIARKPLRRVDVAEMNDRIFINNSAIGLYPLMVIDRDEQRKRLGRSKRLAMVVASIRTLARFNHQRLILTVNDEKERVDTPLLFVGNNDYRIDLGAPGQRESLDDGELSVFVMRKKTRPGSSPPACGRCSTGRATTTWRRSRASSASASRATARSWRCRSTAKSFTRRRRSTIKSASGHCG